MNNSAVTSGQATPPEYIPPQATAPEATAPRKGAGYHSASSASILPPLDYPMSNEQHQEAAPTPAATADQVAGAAEPAPILDYTDLSGECQSGNGLYSPNCAIDQPLPNTGNPSVFAPGTRPSGSQNHPAYQTPDLELVPAIPPACRETSYLDSYVGHRVEVQFVLGASVVERIGILRGVDSDHIILESAEHGDLIMGSLDSVKLVTVLQS